MLGWFEGPRRTSFELVFGGKSEGTPTDLRGHLVEYFCLGRLHVVKLAGADNADPQAFRGPLAVESMVLGHFRDLRNSLHVEVVMEKSSRSTCHRRKGRLLQPHGHGH